MRVRDLVIRVHHAKCHFSSALDLDRATVAVSPSDEEELAIEAYLEPGTLTVLDIPLVVDKTMADGDAQIRFPI